MAPSIFKSVQEIIELSNCAKTTWAECVKAWDANDGTAPVVKRKHICSGPLQQERFPECDFKVFRFGIYSKLALWFFKEISESASWYSSIENVFSSSELGISLSSADSTQTRERVDFVSSRLTGPAGSGKSYAVMQLVFRLRLRRDIFRVLYINIPLEVGMFFIEEIKLMMAEDLRDASLEVLLNSAFSNPTAASVLILLSTYKSWCEEKGLKVIYICDQENAIEALSSQGAISQLTSSAVNAKLSFHAEFVISSCTNKMLQQNLAIHQKNNRTIESCLSSDELATFIKALVKIPVFIAEANNLELAEICCLVGEVTAGLPYEVRYMFEVSLEAKAVNIAKCIELYQEERYLDLYHKTMYWVTKLTTGYHTGLFALLSMLDRDTPVTTIPSFKNLLKSIWCYFDMRIAFLDENLFLKSSHPVASKVLRQMSVMLGSDTASRSLEELCKLESLPPTVFGFVSELHLLSWLKRNIPAYQIGFRFTKCDQPFENAEEHWFDFGSVFPLSNGEEYRTLSFCCSSYKRWVLLIPSKSDYPKFDFAIFHPLTLVLYAFQVTMRPTEHTTWNTALMNSDLAKAHRNVVAESILLQQASNPKRTLVTNYGKCFRVWIGHLREDTGIFNKTLKLSKSTLLCDFKWIGAVNSCNESERIRYMPIAYTHPSERLGSSAFESPNKTTPPAEDIPLNTALMAETSPPYELRKRSKKNV